MIRVRFETKNEKPKEKRKHPSWCAEHSLTKSIVVSYADDIDEIKRLWPDAVNIQFTIELKYTFTDRFPKPNWFKEEVIIKRKLNRRKKD